MKRIISLILLTLMFVTIMPVVSTGDLFEGNYQCRIGSKYYETLEKGVTAALASDSGIIELNPDADRYPKAWVTGCVNTYIPSRLSSAYTFHAFNPDVDEALALKYDNNPSSLNEDEQLYIGEKMSQLASYTNWNADFEISFDSAVAADDVRIMGDYANYNWLYNAEITVPELGTDTSVRLLYSVSEWWAGQFTYEYMLKDVFQFHCGVINNNPFANAGKTMSVSLYMYYPGNSNIKILVGTTDYTFPNPEEEDTDKVYFEITASDTNAIFGDYASNYKGMIGKYCFKSIDEAAGYIDCVKKVIENELQQSFSDPLPIAIKFIEDVDLGNTYPQAWVTDMNEETLAAAKNEYPNLSTSFTFNSYSAEDKEIMSEFVDVLMESNPSLITTSLVNETLDKASLTDIEKKRVKEIFTSEFIASYMNAKWIGEYAVYFKGEGPENGTEVPLIGSYSVAGWEFGWLPGGFTYSDSKPEVLLLQNLGGYIISYDMILGMKEFNCGVDIYDQRLAGKTMVVELRMYEANNNLDSAIMWGKDLSDYTTGTYAVMSSTEYTFPERITANDEQTFIFDDEDNKYIKATTNAGVLSYSVKAGSDVISVDSSTGKVTINKVGTATVLVTSTVSGCDATKEITVNIIKGSKDAPKKGEGYVIESGVITADAGFELYDGVATNTSFTILPSKSYYVRYTETNKTNPSPYTAIDTTISINVLSGSENMGSVSTDGLVNGRCSIGTEITLTATPNEEYKFVNWTDSKGTVVSSDTDYVFSPTISETYIANFKHIDKEVVEIPKGTNGTYGTSFVAVATATNYSLSGSTYTSVTTPAGLYTAYVSLKDTKTQIWSDGTTDTKTIKWNVFKANQEVPEGITGTDNAIIVGTNTNLEYKGVNDTEYILIDKASVTDLNPGTYYVRKAGDGNYYPSASVVVVVSEPTIEVTTLQPSPVLETSATLRAVASSFNEDKIESQGFMLNGTEYPVSTKAAIFSYDISSLNEDTDYIVKAYVETKSHKIYYGNEYRFHTPATVKPVENKGRIDVKAAFEGTPQNLLISIEYGNDVIASQKIASNTNISASFENLPDGNYNIVVRTENGDYTETRMVTIENGSSEEIVYTIASGKISTVVDIKTDDTPKVAVEGLPEILTEKEKNDAAIGDKTIEVKLEAVAVKTEELQDDDNTKIAISEIESIIPKATEVVEEKIKTVLDINLVKTTTEVKDGEVKNVDVKDIGHENETVIEIAIPYKANGKTVKVYRYHNGEASPLTLLNARAKANYIDGTYYAEDNFIYIYASGFSTYVISTEEEIETPAEDTNNVVGGSTLIAAKDEIPVVNIGERPEIIVVVKDDLYYVNGNVFSSIAPIFIDKGRTFLGVRDIANALGIDPMAIKWNDKTKTATISKSGSVVEVTQGSSIVKVTYGNKIYEVESDASAQIRNDRIYLPFRVIFQIFGYTVDWDGNTKTITCK